MIRQRDPSLTWLPHLVREPIIWFAKRAARRFFYWAWLFDPLDVVHEYAKQRSRG